MILKVIVNRNRLLFKVIGPRSAASLVFGIFKNKSDLTDVCGWQKVRNKPGNRYIVRIDKVMMQFILFKVEWEICKLPGG